MDPLSICVSTITLIGLSTKVTKGLYSFTRYATRAEDHVASLCTETTTLTGFLSSINKTLKSCHHNRRALDLVDANLWRWSDLALQDCEATLNELSTFVEKLETSNKTLLWRAKVAFEMSTSKLEKFRARVKSSNNGLQTVLQIITVSVSLQNNVSQHHMLSELDKLKVYIDVAKRSPAVTRRSLIALSETLATKNLRGLAKAAESFHSSAITSVGSSLGGSIADWPPLARERATSIAGLSPYGQERVHQFVQDYNPFNATIMEARDPPSIESSYSIAGESAELTENPSIPMKSAPNVNFQLPLAVVLEDFAKEKMKDRDFEKATTYLNRALSGEMGPVFETKVQMRLQTRLGICYVLQRKIPEAQEVVSKLEKMGGLEDGEVLHLMHALAMVHFAQYEFTEADDLGTRILHAKLRLLGMSHPETLVSLGFLRHLYDQSNQPIHWEAIRRCMPYDYVYSHPESEFDFLAEHSVLMPAIALRPEQFELPCTSFSEDSPSASAQLAETERALNHDLKRALTRYESQQTDTMNAFPFTTADHPDEETGCPARNGPKRMMSRTMTTMRRRFSTWRSSKPATEGKQQAAAESANPRRSRTVLHKAVSRSRMEPAGHTGLARAKSFLSKLKTEIPVIAAPTEAMPIITAPTQDIFAVYELDSICITREDLAKQPEAADEAQETGADHGALASTPDVSPSELLRVRVPPLDMSLNMIPELSELDSAHDCDLENRVTMVVEDSSDGSISRESSSRSAASGSSYSTNTTVSEAAPASSVDCTDGDNPTVLRSMSQRPEMVQLAKSSSVCSLNASKPFNPSQRKTVSPPFQGSWSGKRRSASLLAAINSTYKPDGRGWRTDPSPKALDLRHGLNNNGYGSYSPDRNTQGLLNVQLDTWRDGSDETHDLKRSFSWIRGDEYLSILKLPNREPQTSNAQMDISQVEDGDHKDGGPHV